MKHPFTAAATPFRALRHRNYRLFFAGQGLSLIGTWMQTVAVAWLVFRLTGSAFILGLVSFLSQFPPVFLAPVAGALSDRFDRRRILIIVQFASMVQALVLTTLTFTGTIAVWHVVVLGIFLGTVNAFEMPTRQSFVAQMVEDRADLPNAIALNSSLFNASRLVGPAVAGALIGFAGEAACFAVNAASYLAAVAALVNMRTPRAASAQIQYPNLLSSLTDGWRYASGTPPIRRILVFVAVMNFTGFSFPVLLPVFATRLLHEGSGAYGFLIAATGIGALAGTLFLASRKSVLGLGKIIAAAMGVFGVALSAFSFSRWLPLSIGLMTLAGFGMMATLASCNTILQSITDDDKRGRVMSFYIMAVAGASPLGSLASGGLSSVIGAQYAALIGGLSMLACMALFLAGLPGFRSYVRPIYREKGIIPEVALGMQGASEIRDPVD